MADRAGSAPQSFRIDKRDRVLRSTYDDFDRLSPVRPSVDAAVEYLAVGNQGVTARAGFAELEGVAAAINLCVNAGTIILNQDVGLIVSNDGVQFHFSSSCRRPEIIAPKERDI